MIKHHVTALFTFETTEGKERKFDFMLSEEILLIKRQLLPHDSIGFISLFIVDLQKKWPSKSATYLTN